QRCQAQGARARRAQRRAGARTCLCPFRRISPPQSPPLRPLRQPSALRAPALRVEYRSDKIGNVQLRVGKVSFSRDDLARNVQAVVDEIVRVKPASAKGRYMMSITVSSTMGPGVKIDPTRTKVVDEALASA